MSGAAESAKSVVVKSEIKLETRPGDDLLNSRELRQFSLFRRLKKPINVEKFPGAMVFRRYQKGETICQQGEAGSSAFYVPTADDMSRWNSLKAGEESKLDDNPDALPQQILTAYILSGMSSALRKSWLKSIFSPKLSTSSASLVAIPNDGPTDVDPETRTAGLMEGDVFGEMSCLNFAPRSATVIANLDCYLIEFNRNIFDQLQKDQNYRTWMDQVYVERVLNTHLRGLELFRDLNESQLQQLRDAVSLEVVDPGSVICEEGESANGKPLDVFVIRSGVVQVAQNAGFSLKESEVDWKILADQLLESRSSAVKPAPPQKTAPTKPGGASPLDLLRQKGGSKDRPADDTSKPSPLELARQQGASAGQKKPSPLDLARQQGASNKESSAGQGEKKPSPLELARQQGASGKAKQPSPLELARKQGASIDVVQKESKEKEQTVGPEPTPAAERNAQEAAREFLQSHDKKIDQGLPPEEVPERKIDYLRSTLPKTAGNLRHVVYCWLSDEVQDAVEAISQNDENAERPKSIVLCALQELTQSRAFLQSPKIQDLLLGPELSRRIASFPNGIKGIKKDWSELEVRIAGRAVLSAIFPDAIRATTETSGMLRTLAYMSRGDCFGEISVVRNEPRTASCIAYDHPVDGSGRKPGRVELVRIPGSAFKQLMDDSPALAERVQQMAGSRLERSARDETGSGVAAMTSSPEFQNMGLFQGTKLLLIDLDSCTRCGDCVHACVETHEDGYTRLFLDGPRFDRFLVPSACRSCLNPSCMIGCPVGSISRGDNGQIQIHDWCIGCALCAQQCPYDSIQMHDLGLIPAQTLGWRFASKAKAGDSEKWARSKSVRGEWGTGMSPFFWNANFKEAAGAGDSTGSQTFCFRYQFNNDKEQKLSAQFRLYVKTPAAGVQVWLNGQQVELTQSPPQKKRGEREAAISAQQIRRSNNLLSVEIQSSEPFEELSEIFNVRLDQVAEASQRTAEVMEGEFQAELELVTERAAVCDLCSSLPSQDPACVTSCPHEAAMRVNPLVNFPS